LPARPLRRPAPRRVHTLFFWTIFFLFVAALGYLGLLAFSGASGHLIDRAAIADHFVAEFVVALCVVAAVAGGIVTRHHLR
jgi:hypothetical protein